MGLKVKSDSLKRFLMCLRGEVFKSAGLWAQKYGVLSYSNHIMKWHSVSQGVSLMVEFSCNGEDQGDFSYCMQIRSMLDLLGLDFSQQEYISLQLDFKRKSPALRFKTGENSFIAVNIEDYDSFIDPLDEVSDIGEELCELEMGVVQDAFKDLRILCSKSAGHQDDFKSLGIHVQLVEDDFVRFSGVDNVRYVGSQIKSKVGSRELMEKGFVLPYNFLPQLISIGNSFKSHHKIVVERIVGQSWGVLAWRIKDDDFSVKVFDVLIEKQYPDFLSLLKQKKNNYFLFKTSIFFSALKRVNALGDTVIFKFPGQNSSDTAKVVLGATKGEKKINFSREEVLSDKQIINSDDTFMIGVRLSFFMEAFSRINSEMVLIGCDNYMSSMFVIPMNGQDAKRKCNFIIMPLKIDDVTFLEGF